MTQREFLSNLDFTEAKKVLTKEFGIKDIEMNVKNNRHFSIDLKQSNSKILNSIFNNKKCLIISDKIEVTNDSYKANVMFKGPALYKIGELNFTNGKWNYTKTNNTSNTPKVVKSNKTNVATKNEATKNVATKKETARKTTTKKNLTKIPTNKRLATAN